MSTLYKNTVINRSALSLLIALKDNTGAAIVPAGIPTYTLLALSLDKERWVVVKADVQLPMSSITELVLSGDDTALIPDTLPQRKLLLTYPYLAAGSLVDGVDEFDFTISPYPVTTEPIPPYIPTPIIPSVVNIIPSGVQNRLTFTVYFSTPIQASTVGNTTAILKDSAGAVIPFDSIIVTPSGLIAMLSVELKPIGRYELLLTDGILSVTGGALVPDSYYIAMDISERGARISVPLLGFAVNSMVYFDGAVWQQAVGPTPTGHRFFIESHTLLDTVLVYKGVLEVPLASGFLTGTPVFYDYSTDALTLSDLGMERVGYICDDGEVYISGLEMV